MMHNRTLLSRLKDAWMHYWFAPVSATGFGLMRMGFGMTVFLTYFLQWNNAVFYFSDKGIFPPSLAATMLRSDFRFSLLDYWHSPLAVQVIFFVLLLALIFVTIGLYTHVSLIVVTLLLFSLQEYGVFLLDGGDTVARFLACILLLSPCHRSFSLWNLERRLTWWKKHGVDQPSAQRSMSVWPYRLLLWQMIMLYTASAYGKWLGSMWHDGSAVGSVLLHRHFSRISPDMVHRFIEPFSPFLTYYTIGIQALWILLIILPLMALVVPPWRSFLVNLPMKRMLLLGGVALHVGIALFMDVGTFSFIMMTAYLGLLTDDDCVALRTWCNRRCAFQGYVILCFDGQCGLCRQSMMVMHLCDVLRRLKMIDLHDAKERKRYISDIPLRQLQHAMHVRTEDGRTFRGFYAFRVLAWHIPCLWLLLPFMYIPGVDRVGVYVYDYISKRRRICATGACGR